MLVALIAVVAIGVLFFVAWRFGPGEAASPPTTYTVTSVEKSPQRNNNPELAPVTTTATTDSTDRLGVAARVPVSLRVDVRNASTWVKITRISTGKVIAQKQVEAGAQLGGGALEDRLRLRGRDRHPGQRHAGRQRPRLHALGRRADLDRHGRLRGHARRPGQDPEAPVTEQQ